MLLNKTVSVWRKVFNNSTAQYTDTQALKAIRCAIVPISSFDVNIPFARESTHVIWVPFWVDLRKSDEVRWGQLQPVPEGPQNAPWSYTINGRRQFDMGIPQRAYYARELD